MTQIIAMSILDLVMLVMAIRQAGRPRAVNRSALTPVEVVGAVSLADAMGAAA